MLDRAGMVKRLNQIEQLASGSKFSRLANQPARYLFGQFYDKIWYSWTRKGKLARCDLFFGDQMETLLPAGMDLFLLGAKSHDSEIRLAKFMIRTLGEGHVFVDVGAHFGYFSLLAARLVGESGRVVSMEASEATFRILEKNTTGTPVITPLHLAAGEREAILEFFEFPVLYSEYNTLDPGQFAQSNWIRSNPPRRTKVRARRLDKLLLERNLRPELIKIDVEGAEEQVVKGLSGLFDKGVWPVIVMEYLSIQRGNQAHQQAAKSLVAHGHCPHRIGPEGKLHALRPEEIGEYLNSQGLESDNLVFITG